MRTYSFEVYNFLNSIGITLDQYDLGIVKDLPVRYLKSSMTFQIGESTKTFDRWANSIAIEFDLTLNKDRRKLTRFIGSLS